jgi:hypothetical protein
MKTVSFIPEVISLTHASIRLSSDLLGVSSCTLHVSLAYYRLQVMSMSFSIHLPRLSKDSNQ